MKISSIYIQFSFPLHSSLVPFREFTHSFNHSLLIHSHSRSRCREITIHGRNVIMKRKNFHFKLFSFHFALFFFSENFLHLIFLLLFIRKFPSYLWIIKIHTSLFFCFIPFVLIEVFFSRFSRLSPVSVAFLFCKFSFFLVYAELFHCKYS